MRLHRTYVPLAGAAVAALAAATLAAPATAATRPTPARAAVPKTDVRPVADSRLDKLPLLDADGNRLKVTKRTVPARRTSKPSATAAKRATRQAVTAVTASEPVGTVRQWVALDDTLGVYYLKDFELKAAGDHIEVWVAKGTQGPDGEPTSTDTEFLPGDCRNNRVQVTTAQAEYLANEFDTRIFPKESAAFSVAPDRDGSQPGLEGLSFPGPGQKIVTLVDNVRDDQFYDLNNSKAYTYIAGFFSSTINAFTDRNVMTIDAYDWLHRTGATPPDDAVPGDNCASAPARPYLYESTFAHEYQHLLESYVDPDETSWVNEGLSDFAQTLVGYVDASKPISNAGFDSHVQCFYGALRNATPANPNPREACGPENSLTLWEDQGGDEVLADYGAAYSFMLFLYDRYGLDFMTRLHRDPANGLQSVTDALAAKGKKDTAQDVLHDWAAMIALDKPLSDSSSANKSLQRRYSTPSLDASVNWASPYAYDTPGAPANGSDYVRLRNAAGTFLPASAISGIEFAGASTLEPLPVEWTVDTDPPGHPNDSAFYSGSGSNFDRSLIRQVTVPSANPKLSFDTQWSTEAGWDFGVVQISTDGGTTYTTLSNADTTAEHDPGAEARIVANLPGFTGESNGWRNESFDLSAYAGKDILVSFRYLTDSGVDQAGWWLDNIAVGSTPLADGTSVSDWKSATQVSPVPVSGFTVQVVGYDSTGASGKVDLVDLKLKKGFTGSLTGGKIRSLFGPSVDTIAAIVTYDEPTETVTQQARYSLTVNGVLQPGG